MPWEKYVVTLNIDFSEKEPFVREVEVGANIAEVEILQKKFMDFRSNLTEKKIELIGILTKTEKIQVCLQTDFTKTLLAKTEVRTTVIKIKVNFIIK